MGRITLNGLYWFLSLGIGILSLVIMTIAAATTFGEIAPHLAHYISGSAVPLAAHVIFGPLALVLAPFQFWKGLRTKRPSVHRFIGYTYAISVAIAGVASLALLPAFIGSMWAATGFTALALAWMFATTRAVLFARDKDFARHKRWMIRSAALTFAAVALRLLMPPLIIFGGMTPTQTYDVTGWASWLIPLIAVELWMRRKAMAQRTA